MVQQLYVVDSSATRDVAARERADYWRDMIGSYCCPARCEFPGREDYQGQLIGQRTGSFQLVGWKSGHVVYRRTSRDVRCDPDPNYRLMLPIAGSFTLSAHDGVAVLKPGMGVLFDVDVPFACSQTDGAGCLVLSIPRREVDARLNRPGLLVSPLDLTTGLGRLLGDLTRSLVRERAEFNYCTFDAVSERLVDLACMLVLGDDRPIATDHLADVEALVRRYVREHADDPQLNGDAVARGLGWSLRQIQLALQRAGTTPRQVIKEEKLRLARDQLRSPGFQQLSITDIAARLGFSSTSTFSTAFRERFGVRPSDVRGYRTTAEPNTSTSMVDGEPSQLVTTDSRAVAS